MDSAAGKSMRETIWGLVSIGHCSCQHSAFCIAAQNWRRCTRTIYSHTDCHIECNMLQQGQIPCVQKGCNRNITINRWIILCNSSHASGTDCSTYALKSPKPFFKFLLTFWQKHQTSNVPCYPGRNGFSPLLHFFLTLSEASLLSNNLIHTKWKVHMEVSISNRMQSESCLWQWSLDAQLDNEVCRKFNSTPAPTHIKANV